MRCRGDRLRRRGGNRLRSRDNRFRRRGGNRLRRGDDRLWMGMCLGRRRRRNGQHAGALARVAGLAPSVPRTAMLAITTTFAAPHHARAKLHPRRRRRRCVMRLGHDRQGSCNRNGSDKHRNQFVQFHRSFPFVLMVCHRWPPAQHPTAIIQRPKVETDKELPTDFCIKPYSALNGNLYLRP